MINPEWLKHDSKRQDPVTDSSKEPKGTNSSQVVISKKMKTKKSSSSKKSLNDMGKIYTADKDKEINQSYGADDNEVSNTNDNVKDKETSERNEATDLNINENASHDVEKDIIIAERYEGSKSSRRGKMTRKKLRKH